MFKKKNGRDKCGLAFGQTFFGKRLDQQEHNIAEESRPKRVFSASDADGLIPMVLEFVSGNGNKASTEGDLRTKASLEE